MLKFVAVFGNQLGIFIQLTVSHCAVHTTLPDCLAVLVRRIRLVKFHHCLDITHSFPVQLVRLLSHIFSVCHHKLIIQRQFVVLMLFLKLRFNNTVRLWLTNDVRQTLQFVEH